MLLDRETSTVVVLGGGFAGLRAAKGLVNVAGVRVVLIDPRNHHLFQPLLYQVATAGLTPADIAVPIRAQFRRARNVEVRLGRAERVDLGRRVVAGDGFEISYDVLVLACGARHSYFGQDDWEEHAPGLKTLEQATEIRRRILLAFELAENQPATRRDPSLLTFVVVGAGPTGVELAGAIADISRTVLRRDFRRIDTATARVVLIEAGPRVLPAFPPELSERARRDLVALGVEVRLDSMVTAVDRQGVLLGVPGGTEHLAARSVFWAAGVEAERLEIVPEPERDRAGRIRTGADLSLPGHSEVFVAGDLLSFELAPGQPLPGQAPAAIQAGAHVAGTLRRDLSGRPRRPFRYRDKGQMATLGKSRAIVEIGRVRFAGRLAWLAWLGVHIVYLIGFRNRIAVLAQWAWSYLFSRRGSRLITERDWRRRH